MHLCTFVIIETHTTLFVETVSPEAFNRNLTITGEYNMSRRGYDKTYVDSKES